MKKRLISTALALCMVLAMMPAAFAASSAPTVLEWVEKPGEIQKEFTDGENYPEKIYIGSGLQGMVCAFLILIAGNRFKRGMTNV